MTSNVNFFLLLYLLLLIFWTISRWEQCDLYWKLLGIIDVKGGLMFLLDDLFSIASIKEFLGKKKKCEVNVDVWNYQIRSLCGCSNFNLWCLRPWSAALRVQKFRMLEMDAPCIWIKWFIYHLKRKLSGLQPKMLNATNA